MILTCDAISRPDAAGGSYNMWFIYEAHSLKLKKIFYKHTFIIFDNADNFPFCQTTVLERKNNSKYSLMLRVPNIPCYSCTVMLIDSRHS